MSLQDLIKFGSREHRRILLFGLVCGLIWILILCCGSPGSPLDDEIAHFNISRSSWAHPAWILDSWGRAVNTLCYMPLTVFGLAGARLISVIFAFATVLCASAVAQRGQVRYYFLVPFFLWFQPWYCGLSYYALTEVPFSFFFILGFYFFVSERLRAASFCFGLLPLIRHEAIAIFGVWLVYLILKRRWGPVLLCVAPLAVYNLVYGIVFAKPAFLVYVHSNLGNFYGKGSWLYFLKPLFAAAGAPVLAMAFFSIWRLDRLRELWVVGILLYVVYFFTHVILFHFGLYASGGQVMFLLPLAPILAVAAAAGLEFIEDHNLILNTLQANRRPLSHALVIVLSIVSAALLGAGVSRYRPLSDEVRSLKQAADYLHRKGVAVDKVVAKNAWFVYFYDLPIDRRAVTGLNYLDRLEPGEMLVWDRHYSERRGFLYKYLMDPRHGWRRSADFNGIAVIFEKMRFPVNLKPGTS